MNSEPTQLRIRTTREAQQTVVQLEGEIDLRSSPDLRSTLLELIDRAPGRVIVDLSGIAYMDSSGVGTLVEMKRRLERNGGRLILAALQPRVRSVFEITRLDKFFTIADSVEEARRL